MRHLIGVDSQEEGRRGSHRGGNQISLLFLLVLITFVAIATAMVQGAFQSRMEGPNRLLLILAIAGAIAACWGMLVGYAIESRRRSIVIGLFSGGLVGVFATALSITPRIYSIRLIGIALIGSFLVLLLVLLSTRRTHLAGPENADD